LVNPGEARDAHICSEFRSKKASRECVDGWSVGDVPRSHTTVYRALMPSNALPNHTQTIGTQRNLSLGRQWVQQSDHVVSEFFVTDSLFRCFVTPNLTGSDRPG
jgi:hypothetical protein